MGKSTLDKGMRIPETPSQDGHHDLETHLTVRLGLAYGRFIYRFRWLIVALWVIILGTSIIFALRVPALLSGGGIELSDSESAQVNDILIGQFGQPPSTMLVAFQSQQTAVSDPAYQQQVTNVRNSITTFPHFKNVMQGPAGKDDRTTYLLVGFDKNLDAMQQYVPDMRQKVNDAGKNGPASVYLTGSLALTEEIVRTSMEDTERADLTALPLALLVLLIVFGTLSAAVMPLFLALIAIPTAFAMIYPLALDMPLNSFVVSVASIIGLGTSIDYSLFIIRRFREELASGSEVREAIAWTLATAGEAILFSGLTVMIGFIGLLLINLGITNSVAIGGAAVVIAAVMGALTLLPAVLSLMGPRINSLRVPYLWKLTMASPTSTGEGFWHRLALWVMKRPVIVTIGVCIILFALAWPVFFIKVGTSGADALPTSSEGRQGYDILEAQYPKTFKDQTIDIIASSGSAILSSSSNLQHIADLSNWLSKQSSVTSVTSVMNPPSQPGAPVLSEEQLIAIYTSGAYKQNPALSQFASTTAVNNEAHIIVKSSDVIDSDASRSLVDNLRDHATQQAGGLDVLVGGVQAVYLDFDRYLYGNFTKTVIFIVISTFILLTIMFRSLLIPLKAILMNAISLGAAYGVLVIIFQWGYLSNILGFTSNGYVDSIVPIVMFCVLFGLSMDYEVFLLSRIREEWLRTYNNRLAVARGLEMTGSVITNAALLFIIVTAAFIFTSQTTTKALGVGMTVAILVDAAIIRTLLVPATMRLLGRWNWWFPGLGVPPKQKE